MTEILLARRPAPGARRWWELTSPGVVPVDVGLRPYLDAGAVPTTGAPAASYPAGVWGFQTNILVQGTLPQISSSSFGPRMAQTLAELTGGVADGADFTIERGTRVMTEVSPSIISRIASVAGAAALATLAGPVAAMVVTPAAIASVTAGGQIPGYWVTVRGVFRSPSGFRTADLNRAIARAFANTTTFPAPIAAFAGRMPPAGDGSMLLARLSQPDACTGGADYTAVYARACTRIGPAAVMTPIPAPSTPSPNATQRPPPAPTPAPVPTPQPPVNTPAVRPVSTTPARPPASQQVRVTPVAPQVLVQTPPASSTGVRWYWWALGGALLGGIGLAVWKRREIAVWWKRK